MERNYSVPMHVIVESHLYVSSVNASIQFPPANLFILSFPISSACLAHCLFVCLYTSLFSFHCYGLGAPSVVLDCESPLFFCVPLPPSVPSLPPSPSWFGKCFGLQRMMVDAELNEWLSGQLRKLPPTLKESFKQPNKPVVYLHIGQISA